MTNNKFLTGCILREVKNGRLNCANAKDASDASDAKNGTFVKKISRQGENFKEVFPYASAQNQKKIMKDYFESRGLKISFVKSVSTTEAVNEGNPFSNIDEDIMGFMNAKAITITEEEYNELDEKERVGFMKKGRQGYKKDVTKKRRAKLMMSALQAISHTKITNEFCTRQTDDTPILYAKQVYSADMSSSFVLDVANVGKFNANNNVADYRDFNIDEASAILDREIDAKTESQVEFELGRDERLKRINATLEALRVLNSKITMTNNLEDLSARFIILAEYSIGHSVFNNIFADNELKVDFLKQAIEENEQYRLSKIYVGCREQYFKKDDTYLADLLRSEFAEDARVEVCGVKEAIDRYSKYLEETLV